VLRKNDYRKNGVVDTCWLATRILKNVPKLPPHKRARALKLR
jgi:hypothetical protein